MARKAGGVHSVFFLALPWAPAPGLPLQESETKASAVVGQGACITQNRCKKENESPALPQPEFLSAFPFISPSSYTRWMLLPVGTSGVYRQEIQLSGPEVK